MRLNSVVPAAFASLVRTALLALVFVPTMAVPAMAQEWSNYKSVQDGFQILFPGQPTVTETTWKSEFDFMLPARVYSAERGRERYSLTVVDYDGIEQQGIEHVRTCAAGAEPCFGSVLSGPGYWKHDVRGALIYATFGFLQRDATVTHYLWNHQDLIEGQELQLTNNADQSRTMVFIAMHEMKLYIVEGTVPEGYPPAAMFQNAMGWVDADGARIRYQTIYSNQYYGLKQYPLPTRVGGGRGGGAGAAAQP
jgi:hypothetical protein